MNFFYEKEGLCLVLGESTIRYFSQGQVLSELTQDGAILCGCDTAKSVIRRLHVSNATSLCYTPYGHLAEPFAKGPALRFKDAHYDPVISAYALGRGYRFFSPSLMRFQKPDTHSPFGKGGLNSYAFCLGDPVNYSDPTGQSGGRITGFFRKLWRGRKQPTMRPQTQRNTKLHEPYRKEEIAARKWLEEQRATAAVADGAHRFVMENAHVTPVIDVLLKHLPYSYAGVIPGRHEGNMGEMLVADIKLSREFLAKTASEIERIRQEMKSNPKSYKPSEHYPTVHHELYSLERLWLAEYRDIEALEKNLAVVNRLNLG
ncbi:RHS repeat-associated core domain-containing protein [Pseudomonas alabamensis]|uniref:RHS repeat-associated core domain-containing protein n=1 Tax=Pseudomonas alabamensis TaxID=3064349 RepID=UPI003F652333